MTYPIEFEPMVKEAKARWMKEFENKGILKKQPRTSKITPEDAHSERWDAKRDISDAVNRNTHTSRHGEAARIQDIRAAQREQAKKVDTDPNAYKKDSNLIRNELNKQRQAKHVSEVAAGKKRPSWNHTYEGINVINSQRNNPQRTRDSADVFARLNSAEKASKGAEDAARREREAKARHRQANQNEAYQRHLG